MHTQPWGLGSQVGSPHLVMTPGLTQTLGLRKSCALLTNTTRVIQEKL